MTASGASAAASAADRVAIVTGAAGGIGIAVARRLAADGLRLVVSDVSLDLAQKVLADLPGSGHVAVACDVAQEASVDALFSSAVRMMGAPVEVLVQAAGILRLRADGSRPPIVETTLADFEEHHAVNSRGTFLCIRSYLRQWRGVARPQAGRVVTFSSVAAQLGGYRSSSAYIASKGAILALTKAAAREAAPWGITVNSVAPGLIDAPMLRMSLAPEADAQASANIPLNRIGLPSDVAGAVSFLVSADAAYMTGGVLDVNGGYRMQ